jgi:hypothetical protein
VIHVRVRDDDVADGFVLRVGEAEGDASGIHGDAVVNEKTGEPLLLAGATMLVEGAGKKLDFHGRRIRLKVSRSVFKRC